MGKSDLKFYIPLNRADLCKAQHQHQIVVEEVHTEKRVTQLLDGLKEKLRSDGPHCIYDGFDVLYSVLHHFEKLKPEIKEISWTITVKAVCKLSDQLGPLLTNNQRLEIDMRFKYLNLVKMSVYILCQLVDSFEAEATRPSGVVMAEKGRRKTRKGSDNQWWEDNKGNGLNALSLLTQHPINRLWEPPCLEEEFINLINNCCFRMLENPLVVKSKDTKDSLMHLLGFSFSKFGHTLGLSLKIIQLLQHYEHLAVPLAEVVEYLVREHGLKNIVPEIIRETGRIDGKELSRDSVGTRVLAQFLVDLAARIPSAILPSLSLLLTFLEGEAYTMRNCVLGIFGDIVWKNLSTEDMDAKSKHTREQLLDKLEDHILDVNAFVRVKSLQVWNNLCKEKVIPLNRQHRLLRLVTGRLYDKSSQVRKNSVQFITVFLQGNPFTAKLSLQELRQSFETEKEKLMKILPDSQCSNEFERLPNAFDKWETIVKNMKKAIKEFNEIEPEEPLLTKDSNLSDVLKSIEKCIDEGNFLIAVKMAFEAKEMFKGDPIFDKDTENILSDDEEDNESDDSDESESSMMLPILKKIYSFKEPSDIPAPADPNIVNDISKQQVLVQYLKDCVQFAEQIQESIPAVANLLSSKIVSDILEAINFFVTAFEFGVRESLVGVRKMLLLVWSKESTIKEAVVAAYKRLYLNPRPTGDRTAAEEIVHNLLFLLQGLRLGEVASLEELICEFVRSGELAKPIFNVLWDLFSMKQEKNTLVESHGALVLLSMAAKAENVILQKNLDVLITVGLGDRAQNDLLFAKDVCVALFKIPGTSNPSIEAKEPPYRLATEHPLFERLCEIIVIGFCQPANPFWAPLVQQAVKVIYKLAEHPDKIAERLITILVEKITTELSDANAISECLNVHLSRLFCLTGEVALSHLVHLDVNVYTELKRRQFQKDEKKQRKEKKQRHKRRSALGVDLLNKSTMEPENAIDIEMGLVGAEADDDEAEFIAKICENELLREEGLFHNLGPLLIEVCSNPAKFSDKKLRISASLSLAKLMMISSSFCETHLALLVTILDKSQEPVIRGNTIIALGDLSIRFPNLVEPWTPHLYARLRDSSDVVRKNTLLVLMHLILNDLIKVKSQISEVALCIVDKDEKVKKMVKTLFNELAKKGNSVYNILPDIISRLSDPECGTEESNFRTILKFLLSFIDKDKQLEGLVEKLCIRFNSTRTERQDRDLAYCLSLIPCNERCIRKLHENVQCFAEKLRDIVIYESFTALISGSRKGINLKPELKTALDELEKLIEELHTKGISEEDLVQKAKQANQKQKKGKVPPTAGRAAKKRKEKFVDSSSEDEDVRKKQIWTAKGKPAPATVRKSREVNKRTKIPVLTFSDSESEKEPLEDKSDIGHGPPSVRRSVRRKQ